MPVLDKLRNTVLRFDVFSSGTTLRINGESNYESVCGGILSIILICAFIGIFAASFIGVLTKSNPNSASQTV